MGWGWWPGYWVAWIGIIPGKGMAGMGGWGRGPWPQRQGQAKRGREHCGSQEWVPDSAVGTGRSAGALTREGEEDDIWRGSAKAKPRQKIKRKQTHHHPMTLRKLRLG